MSTDDNIKHSRDDDDDEHSSPLVILIFGVFFVSAFIHAINTRTLNDFLTYSSYIAGPFVIFSLIDFFADWTPSPRRSSFIRSGSIWHLLLFIFVISPVAGVTYYTFGVAIKDTYLYLQGLTSGKFITGFLTSAFTLFLAGVLFYFRLKRRAWYGLTEIVVGVTIAVYRVLAIPDGSLFASAELYFAILTAGIYLIVRGMDNIHQGLKDQSIKRTDKAKSSSVTELPTDNPTEEQETTIEKGEANA